MDLFAAFELNNLQLLLHMDATNMDGCSVFLSMSRIRCRDILHHGRRQIESRINTVVPKVDMLQSLWVKPHEIKGSASTTSPVRVGVDARFDCLSWREFRMLDRPFVKICSKSDCTVQISVVAAIATTTETMQRHAC